MMRNSGMIAAVLLLVSGAAPAQGQPERVTVTLSSFKFEPATLVLHHGRSYLLHFTNASDGGHNFVAKEFFAAATLATPDRARLAKGTVELHGGESADVQLVAPAPGKYPVHCGHFMHSSFGMTGTIIVD